MGVQIFCFWLYKSSIILWDLKFMKTKLPTGNELKKRAEELGVVATIDESTEPTGDYQMFRAAVSEAELQRRVIDAERHIQSQRMSLVALVSAGASILSALAAWLAVYLRVLN